METETEQKHTTAAIAAINRELARLAEEAQSIADRYWAWSKTENDRRPKTERFYVGCRVRWRNDNGHPTVAIAWFRNRANTKAERGPEDRPFFSEEIKKGRGPSYTDAALRKHLKGWAVERVLATEKEFADIRRRAGHLTTARRYVTQATK